MQSPCAPPAAPVACFVHRPYACAQRVVRVFESVNFKDYVRLLAPFSQRASRDTKLAAMFNMYDVDGDGAWASNVKDTGGAKVGNTLFFCGAEPGAPGSSLRALLLYHTGNSGVETEAPLTFRQIRDLRGL